MLLVQFFHRRRKKFLLNRKRKERKETVGLIHNLQINVALTWYWLELCPPKSWKKCPVHRKVSWDFSFSAIACDSPWRGCSTCGGPFLQNVLLALVITTTRCIFRNKRPSSTICWKTWGFSINTKGQRFYTGKPSSYFFQ